MRLVFQQQLKQLQDDVLTLASMVEGALLDSVEVLRNRDVLGSRRIIAYDERVNEKRFEIEQNALRVIVTQHPVASDVRYLAAILEIITELERIGDYAKGIARINLLMADKPLAKPLVDLPVMANKVTDMLHRALDSFIENDVEAARCIAYEDDEIDLLYNRIYRDLVQLMAAKPHLFDQATHLLWAAHNLERTGDRVVNICERVVFTVTGDMVELNSPALAV